MNKSKIITASRAHQSTGGINKSLYRNIAMVPIAWKDIPKGNSLSGHGRIIFNHFPPTLLCYKYKYISFWYPL